MRKVIIGMSKEDWEAGGGGDIYPFMHPMSPDFGPCEIVFDPVNYGTITMSSNNVIVPIEDTGDNKCSTD